MVLLDADLTVARTWVAGEVVFDSNQEATP